MIWVIIATIVALPIVWFLIKAIVGFSAPPKYSGKAFLKQQLKTNGVDPSHYSENFLSNIVEEANVAAKGMSSLKLSSFNESFVGYLEGVATIIIQYEQGELSKGLASGSLFETLKQVRPIKQKFEK
jgi:hypothetical protein